jgi:hypothetical protein
MQIQLFQFFTTKYCLLVKNNFSRHLFFYFWNKFTSDFDVTQVNQDSLETLQALSPAPRALNTSEPVYRSRSSLWSYFFSAPAMAASVTIINLYETQ